jgi:hypothetical protein
MQWSWAASDDPEPMSDVATGQMRMRFAIADLAAEMAGGAGRAGRCVHRELWRSTIRRF